MVSDYSSQLKSLLVFPMYEGFAIRGTYDNILGYIDPGLHMSGDMNPYTFESSYTRLRDRIKLPSGETIGFAECEPSDGYPTEEATRVFSRPSVIINYYQGGVVGRINEYGVVTDPYGTRVGSVEQSGLIKDTWDRTIAKIDSGDPVSRMHAGAGYLLLILTYDPHRPTA